MIHEYNIATRPTEQIPVRAIKHRDHQARWILALANDRTFQIATGFIKGTSRIVFDEWTAELPYKQLWKTLADLDLDRRKWWMIGYRMRYLLEMAKLLKALEAGDVHLPTPAKRVEQGKRNGRLTISANCLEIDLVAGTNEIKVIDWDNYGIAPGIYQPDINIVTPQIAEQTLSDFIQACHRWNMSASRTTAAQIGWAQFRVNHMPPTLSCNRDLDARALERRAYFGGRNEAFFLGDVPGKTYCVDVQGCYAKVCTDETLPIHCIEEYHAGLDPARIDFEDSNHWIADVILTTESADYPLQWANAPIYPIGTFRTTLCWPELSHALQFGRVQRILRAAKYAPGAPFASYANWYLRTRRKIRETPLECMSRLLKSSFNASLGYTARRRYACKPWDTDVGLKWFIGHTSAPDGSAPVVQCQILDSIKEWVKIGGEPREAMPMLHATITSWARARLLSLMAWARRSEVLYVDTDGLLLTEQGMRNLAEGENLLGDKPGQLSERFPAGRARIQGQKNYRVGNYVVCAGLAASRHASWAQKLITTTPTGKIDANGVVTPFHFRCIDNGGETQDYRNEID